MKPCGWEYCFQPHKNISVIFLGDVQKSKCKFIFNKIFGGHIWASHVVPGGTLATVGPPSFWDIFYLTRAAGLVVSQKSSCFVFFFCEVFF